MSEAKFTKGEWVTLPIEDDKEYIRIRGTLPGSKYKIANVVDLKAHHSSADWCKLDRAESMANARLIVAAPKMYEMLKSVASELCMLIDEVNDQRASRITSQTESEPDYHDMQTLHEIQQLLKEARGK
jgi:hypothetical protein